jgi:hypothetical protein
MEFICVLFILFDFLTINNTVIDSHFQCSVLKFISAVRTLKSAEYFFKIFYMTAFLHILQPTCSAVSGLIVLRGFYRGFLDAFFLVATEELQILYSSIF